MPRSSVVLLVVAAIIALAFAVYHFSGDQLNVTPDASRQIEKAKQR